MSEWIVGSYRHGQLTCEARVGINSHSLIRNSPPWRVLFFFFF